MITQEWLLGACVLRVLVRAACCAYALALTRSRTALGTGTLY